MKQTNDDVIVNNVGKNWFDDVLLADFVSTFYGYGDYNAPYWFVSMEEGSGKHFDDVEKQLSAWDKRGRQELEDVAEFHRAIGLGQYFDEKPPLEPTWSKLIRILLSVEGQLSSREGPDQQKEKVRAYQRDSLGRVQGGTNCLIELLPLLRASRSLKDWKYAEHSGLPYFSDPKTYEKYYMPKRAERIRELVNQRRPHVVVFYSVDRVCLKWWMHITDAPFSYDTTSKTFIARRDGILFLVTSHPAAKRIENEYFHGVRRLIAGELGK